MNLPKTSLAFREATEPLRKRAPVRDEDGTILSDFMVLFPGLRDMPSQLRQRRLRDIQATLACFPDGIVFAELNLQLNLLWVSIRPKAGLRNEIAWALQDRVPEAKLITHV